MRDGDGSGDAARAAPREKRAGKRIFPPEGYKQGSPRASARRVHYVMRSALRPPPRPATVARKIPTLNPRPRQ